MQTKKNDKAELKIGAVALPKVVTIWEGIREYLCERGLQTEYVLYSSYPALVDALVAGRIISRGTYHWRICRPGRDSADTASYWESPE
jgi:ABC-type phosphate/phosphonate transport system substrate-binding protein